MEFRFLVRFNAQGEVLVDADTAVDAKQQIEYLLSRLFNTPTTEEHDYSYVIEEVEEID